MLTDPAVLKVIAEWAACMQSNGFDRTHPVNDPNFRALGAQPTPEEIREAMADVDCKRKTNLVGVWFTVESVYQNTMIQGNFVALSEIKKQNGAIVRRAADIVAAG